PQKGDGLQVLVAAILVGYPIPRLSPVIEVEHGGNGIHPQAVYMILVEPEEGVADEEIGHLAATVIEDERPPVALLPLAGIARLVEMRTVEESQAGSVTGEMSRHP